MLHPCGQKGFLLYYATVQRTRPYLLWHSNQNKLTNQLIVCLMEELWTHVGGVPTPCGEEAKSNCLY